MAEVKSYVRLWPFLFAAIGVAGFAYAGWKWMHPPGDGIDIGDAPPLEPVTDPGPDEHFEKVRPFVMDETSEYVGEVKNEAPVILRAPRGMRVPITKVWHEQGDFVKKGDVLLSFHKPQIDEAIEKAHSEGRSDDEARFRGYLDYVEFKAPFDGVVLSVDRTTGEVPIDDGIGIITMADKSSYRFVVQVPGEVQRGAMALGTKFDVVLQDNLGTVRGEVSQFLDPVDTDVPVVLALEPHEGVEQRLKGTVKVPTGKREAGLVPKKACFKEGDLSFVRVWDPDSKSIGKKSVKLGDAKGDDVVVLAGVFAGDSIVCPGRRVP